MAAALIQPYHHAADSGVFFSGGSQKPLPPSKVSHISHVKALPLYSEARPYLSPSFPLSKSPSFQHFSIPNQFYNSHQQSNSEILRLLKLSVQHNDAELSKVIHASIVKSEEGIRLWNCLISSYVGLGHLDYGEKVFNSIPDPDVVSFTAMISGFAKSRRENEALKFFFYMRDNGVEPNGYTFVALLTACMRSGNLELGSQVHAFVVKTGYLACTYVANALMGLYSECDCLDFVINLFDDMSIRDVASWNTAISCLVKCGFYDRAFELFHGMLTLEGCGCDYFTLSSLLVASAKSFSVKKGLAIHALAHKIGYERNLSVRNALIEFYVECGCIDDVETLFHSMLVQDVFTWTELFKAYMRFGFVDLGVDIFDRMPEKNAISFNTLLAGLCCEGDGSRALRYFHKMLEGLELNESTITSVLRACGRMGDLQYSEQIHALVLKLGCCSDDKILATLLDTCTRCARIDDAEKIFHRLEQRCPVTLTTMICGYARNMELDKAISLIRHWEYEEHPMDEVASASILGFCGDLGFQNLGEQLHCYALKNGFIFNTGVGNGLISMYSKCGDIKEATKIFNSISFHDTVSWNCLLTGYILSRQGDESLKLWSRMKKRRVHPDSITCSLIITSYKHTKLNLVQQCHEFLLSMKSRYNVDPTSDHYASLVSVFGKWGLLEEAEDIILNMPFKPKPSVWKALLESCNLHKNFTVGKRTARRILSMDPQEPSAYILKSNLYAASGQWHYSELVKREMKDKGFRKFPARSWTIYRNEVHSFFARDNSHPESKDINSALNILFLECMKAGYEPDTSFVLHEVEEYQKTNFLMYHSAKMAVTFGILKNQPGKPVKVMKNIRLCGDCHSFFKFASLVSKREIHVRDASGFHCFAAGECSCKDYW